MKQLLIITDLCTAVIRDAATKLPSTSPLSSSFHLADDLPNISHVVANVSARSSELAPLVSESWQKDVRSLNSERSRSLTTSLGAGKNVDYSLPPAGSALSPVDPATGNSPPGNTISSSTTSSSFINSSILPMIDFSSAPSSFLSKPTVPSPSIVTSISLLSTSSSTKVQTVPVSISAAAPSPIFPSTSSFQASEIAMYSSKTTKNNTLHDSTTQPELDSGTSSLELEPSISRSTSEATASSQSASEVGFSGIAGAESNVDPSRPSAAPISSSAVLPVFGNANGGKNDNSDATSTQEDEMEEEAPEISQTTELSIGNLGGFGIGTAPNPSAAKSNPFGAPFVNTVATPPSSSISMTVPGELFRPASFSFPQPSQSSQPTNLGGFDTAGQVSTGNRFGQPAQIGSGQQALGSVLGAFGQSRQFGTGIAGSGFAGNQSIGGFSNTPSSGGFASLASTSGGFSGVGSAGAGFATAATGGGGFAAAATGGGGFAAAATGGGGFAAAATGGGGFAGAALGLFCKMIKVVVLEVLATNKEVVGFLHLEAAEELKDPHPSSSHRSEEPWFSIEDERNVWNNEYARLTEDEERKHVPRVKQQAKVLESRESRRPRKKKLIVASAAAMKLQLQPDYRALGPYQ
ncbi:hypothetical protein RJ640_003095 [Escallonia rubra]|uniref:Uncharacterized protein n=1 Tax=Escallonia rubra TaxID=112253 RepID=A0AA88R1Z2_9ASTE|nr:hypothetical protein RJ640_003095 [Escallonia rubra]